MALSLTQPEERARRFASLHTHGFVRVAVSTPRVHVADPASNADAILAEARRAAGEGVDLLVYPNSLFPPMR